MKQIAPNYTYNKTTGVITLTGVDIDRDQLLLIVNTTRNVTYYNFADSATTLQAFTKGANTSITLASSVISASSAHANEDALTIYYDDQSNQAVTIRLADVQIASTNINDSTTAGRALLTAATAQAQRTALNIPVELVVACSDETTQLTTGDRKVTFRSPCAFTLTSVKASLRSTSNGLFVVDINKNGTSVLSTKLYIDPNETTSTTAFTQAVISNSFIEGDAEITIDIDQVGSTIAGSGLKVTLIGTRL